MSNRGRRPWHITARNADAGRLITFPEGFRQREEWVGEDAPPKVSWQERAPEEPRWWTRQRRCPSCGAWAWYSATHHRYRVHTLPGRTEQCSEGRDT
jgi:hypothetical protein